MDGATRPRIVVVLDTYSDYGRRIVARLGELVDRGGFELLVMAGGALAAAHESSDAGDRSSAGESPFDALIAGVQAAGVIVLSGALGQDLERTQIERLLQRILKLARIPMVSLAMPAPGIASVGSDDVASVRALLEHVTDDPSRRRFAFLRGHRASHDSQQREALFRDVLAERGLPIDERWFLDADFSPSKAYRLFDALLESGARPDGVVAASDAMAAAVVRVLNRHGLRVPDDVVVAGFDDDETASLSSPPLTTVRLPVEHQVDLAFTLLRKQLRGWTPPAEGHHVVVPGTLIKRKSTGCIDAQDHGPTVPRSQDGFSRQLRAALSSASAPALDDPVALADAISQALLLDEGEPVARLRTALRARADGSIDAPGWRHVQDALDTLVRGPMGKTLAPGAAATLSRLHGTIVDALRSLEQQRQLDADTRRDAAEAMHLALGRCTTREQIHTALDIGLGTLGIATACLCLYDGDVSVEGRRHVSADFLWTDGRRRTIDATAFPTTDVFPPSLAARSDIGTFLVVPVHVAGLQYGYLLCDSQLPEGVSIEGIVQSLAGALQHGRHIGSLEQTAREMHTANADLARLAGRDHLTGLRNRSGLEQELARHLGNAAETGEALALLYFDLDGFKAINDTHGHAAGDRLLRTVAARVRRALRSTDTVARLGGDEFTVILPGVADRHGAAGIARMLLAELARPVPIDNASVNLSASIGIARFPEDGDESEALLRHADAAMYRAKAEGRNRYAWFCRSMEQRELDRLELDRALRQALGAGELSLAWQPRVALANGRTLGFEALLRWHSEDSVGRAVGPGEFVPLAERTGYVRELDAFAFEQACRQLALWQSDGLDTRVSVNLSAASLHDDGLTERMRRELERHAVDPRFMELELTESAAMRDIERTIAQLETLRSYGLRLSIDDFGTAYSSLNYLKRLPVDSLKIDRSFVKDITRSDGGTGADAAIARAIVALGHELGFAIVAEGIETPAQRDFFAALGCDEAQGYLFGRPVPSVEADRLLRDVALAQRAA